MLPELEHLIRLQQLENTAMEARGQLHDIPTRLESLQTRIAERVEEVTAARGALEEHRTTRAALERDVADVQSRLSRFKEQLMSVKTNKEYQAMQTEIAGAEHSLRQLEDQLLERMLEADELNRNVADTEQRLAEERTAVDAERAGIEEERMALETRLTAFDAERSEVGAQLSRQTMALFETLARGRKGVAVVKAHQGRCTSCHVRLRPQLFNHVRSNNSLIQCESCQRILYFADHPHVDE